MIEEQAPAGRAVHASPAMKIVAPVAPDTPVDDRDHALVGHVRPPAWVNPKAAARHDLVVLGGGTAGLVSAMGAAGLGARVALVERHLLGRDCLNTGCVPSKALIRSARAVGELGKFADHRTVVVRRQALTPSRRRWLARYFAWTR